MQHKLLKRRRQSNDTSTDLLNKSSAAVAQDGSQNYNSAHELFKEQLPV